MSGSKSIIYKKNYPSYATSYNSPQSNININNNSGSSCSTGVWGDINKIFGGALGNALGIPQATMSPNTVTTTNTNPYTVMTTQAYPFPVNYAESPSRVFKDILDIMKLPAGDVLTQKEIEAAQKIIYGYNQDGYSLFWNCTGIPPHGTDKHIFLLNKSTIDFMGNLNILRTIYNAVLKQTVRCIPYPIQSHVCADLEPTDFKWDEGNNWWILDTSQLIAKIINT